MKHILLLLIFITGVCSSQKSILELNTDQSIKVIRNEGLAHQVTPTDTLIDEKYILSIGDVLEIDQRGIVFNYQIGPQGTILIDGLGVLSATGKTVEAVRSEFYELCIKKYGSFENFHLRLSRLKMVKIRVNGAIAIEGTSTLAYGERITDALRSAHWFVNKSNSDQIQLRRKSGETFLFNYREYLKSQDQKSNLVLENGDEIYIPYLSPHDPLIEINNQNLSVSTPYYEGSSVEDYYNLSRHYNEGILYNYDFFSIIELNGSVETYPKSKASEVFPKIGTRIYLNKSIPIITISGRVDQRGRFEYRSKWTAADYLGNSGIHSASQNLHSLIVFDSNGKKKTVNGFTYIPLPGDHIELDKSNYEYFKEWVGIVANITGIISTILLLHLQLRLSK
jgi:protein involved in polysaccharide export with SLBB domain